MAFKEISPDTKLDNLVEIAVTNGNKRFVEIGKDVKLDKPDDFIQPLSFKQVISGAISNAPRSAKQFAEDLITPFLNPRQTKIAVAKLVEGLGNKLVPGRQENEQIVDDVVDVFKERYGGVENFKRTLSEDPIGAAGDIASILVPAAATAKAIGGVSKIKTISKAGEAAAKVGGIIEPTTALRKATKATARAIIPKGFASNLFESAAKFSNTIPEARRARLIETSLDNRINLTVGGVDKIRERINAYNERITEIINKSVTSGSELPINALFNEFGSLRKEFSGKPMTRNAQISQIAKEQSEFFKNTGKKTLTPKEAQELKVRIYKETENYYNKIADSPASIKAQQAVARSAKNFLEEVSSEIKGVNVNLGAMKELLEPISKSAKRIKNRDLVGVGVPLKGGAGGVIGGPVGVALGVGIGLLDTPLIKSKIAIIVNSLKKTGAVLPKDSILGKFLDFAPGTAAVVARQTGKLPGLKEQE